ncbi:MAG: zinc-ribbon domain-containing protein [Bacillota bacterium]
MKDFLDKVKQGINRGANIIGVRSKEALDTVKVKSEISAVREKKNAALRELGQTVYEMYLQNDTNYADKINEKCEAIKGLDRQILDKEAELKQVHQQAEQNLHQNACKACGAENDEKAKFCNSCGAKLG